MTAPMPPQGAPVAPSTGAVAAEPTLNQPYLGISFGGAVSRFFKKYATFSGRASRSEFWWATLFCFIVGVVLNIIIGFAPAVSFLSGIWSLAILIPTLALYVRRLHDSNKSGALILLPYGLGIVSSILTIVGVIQFAQGIADALGVDLSQVVTTTRQLGEGELENILHNLINSGQFTSSVVLLVISILLAIVACIFWLVFALPDSKPEGARFDK
ncbi:DUF805 domain-containing protein [Bifidobacterium panos]|uniref:DUF805 domain-containing protein n=1 Tax=Bifidobacterium panos TaxID=2675321 RepID=A0ABX1SZJ2_9BIFI|nr:DUF805 domain-containing protein [Bifidobacterium sp. DSM 109963]NMN02201.1 hypothetical protein [Bifidobacterium sp. DSM 109963]